jgi:hypothetical protein
MHKTAIPVGASLLALAAGLAAPQALAQKGRRVPTPGFRALCYPSRVEAGSGQGGSGHGHARFVTADDLGQVTAFYEQATGERLTPEEPAAGEASEVGAGSRFFCDDSAEPPVPGSRERPRRLVVVRFLAKHTAAYDLTLVISRAEGERFTHVVLDYVKR